MTKKIRKVQLYMTENDCYNELWKVVGTKNRFFCRHVFGKFKTWYYVCDPLGYCELDHPADDIEFIICDKNGKALFHSSNETGSFPTFQETIKEKWDTVSKRTAHHTFEEWKQWLLSFKDTNLYKKEIDEMHGYNENWLYCRMKYVRTEDIPDSQFTYLGSPYKLAKVVYEHTVCHEEFSDIACIDDPFVIDDFYHTPNTHLLLGNDFDDSKYGLAMS